MQLVIKFNEIVEEEVKNFQFQEQFGDWLLEFEEIPVNKFQRPVQ